MKYSHMADAYEKIEATTKRLEMTDHLVEFLRKTPAHIIDKVAYLTQGKLYPDFMGIEIGVAEKLAIRALAEASEADQRNIEEAIKKTGDLGTTAQDFLTHRTRRTPTLHSFSVEVGREMSLRQPLTVERVYETLDEMAKATGSGSMGKKISLLADLLRNASPKEAKYLMRTVTGELRLGMADMTVLEALAIAYGGGKENRMEIERAYNISSDLGRVAKTLAENGIEGIRKITVSIGEPIRPMLAERLGSPQEILDKLGGKCMVEYKYDGERVQAHKNNSNITLFSRRLENITEQYPDAVELLRKYVKPKQAIVEAEIVAVDPYTDEMRPFQELMHRRRKYGIKKAMEEYPISLFAFDVLFVDGQDLTQKPYRTRHKILRRTIQPSDHIQARQYLITDNPDELESFFEEAIENGCEGVICKSLNKNAVYQAGARGWLWIKYKRDYKSEMTDAVDLVTVGAFHGRGKRGGTYGALLLAAYDPEEDEYETVTKCGTGFTDEDLANLPKKLEKHKLPHKSPRVNSTLEADIWFEPKTVIEVIGAEITLSRIHTAAMNKIRHGAGLAIRFPRFTGNYRLDKAAEDATTTNEILEMYQGQLKKVAEQSTETVP